MRKDGRVVIEHMRLDYRLSKPGSLERERIREINRALGRAETIAKSAQYEQIKNGAVISDEEKRPNVVPSGLVAVRMRNSPVAWLVSNRKIGGDEFRAAVDIETAFMALSGALMFKPLTMEKTSPGKRREWDERTSEAVERYRRFAGHWSDRAKQYGDKTLEIVISAVIDQRPFSQIEADIGLRHGKAKQVTVRALRDYAARAGFVDRRTGDRWKVEAAQSFQSSARLLSIAKAKARAT